MEHVSARRDSDISNHLPTATRKKATRKKYMIKQNLKQYKARMRPRTTKYKELFPTKCYTGLI